MARTINVFFLVILGLWTLLSLGAWALFSLGGDFVHNQLDWIFMGDANVVPVAGAVFRFFQNFGLGLVIVVWALGSLLIWLSASILRRLARTAELAYVQQERRWAEAEFEERPMKDVTPPRSAGALPPR
jgi:hypothetical protein